MSGTDSHRVDKKGGIYVASRVSRADIWRNLRDNMGIAYARRRALAPVRPVASAPCVVVEKFDFCLKLSSIAQRCGYIANGYGDPKFEAEAIRRTVEELSRAARNHERNG